MSNNTDTYFSAYAELSKTLRTWFVAYGIGAPLALLTNEKLATAIHASGKSKYIAELFLGGVVLQVILAIVNKVSMWALYYAETQNRFKATLRYRWAYRVSEQYLIDLAIDLASIGLFVSATWTALQAAAL